MGEPSRLAVTSLHTKTGIALRQDATVTEAITLLFQLQPKCPAPPEAFARICACQSHSKGHKFVPPTL
eukprot:5609530-Amphidinium_carterae.1